VAAIRGEWAAPAEMVRYQVEEEVAVVRHSLDLRLAEAETARGDARGLSHTGKRDMANRNTQTSTSSAGLDERFDARTLSSVWITEEAAVSLGIPNTRINLGDPGAQEMYFKDTLLQLIGTGSGRRFLNMKFVVAFVVQDLGAGV
jgi:hypothetical protein